MTMHVYDHGSARRKLRRLQEMAILSGGNWHKFLEHFRDVWLMPYVVIPPP